MANFTGSNLLFTGYSKTADGGDNPKYTGEKDRIRVDKTEMYEVVHFCNQFLEYYDVAESLSNFQKVERLLHSRAFNHVVMRKDLMKLIANNWNI